MLTINFICTYSESSPLLPSLLIHYCREKKQSTLYEALCRDITATSALTTVQSDILNFILQQICLIWKHSLYDLDFIASFLCNVTSSLVIPVLSWNFFFLVLWISIFSVSCNKTIQCLWGQRNYSWNIQSLGEKQKAKLRILPGYGIMLSFFSAHAWKRLL